MELQKPKFYLLIYNISKSKNIGTLIRSASAFGVNQIFVVGNDKKVLKKFFGSQGTVQKSNFLFFDSILNLEAYCKSNNINFCGVEIGEYSKPVHQYEFKGDTLFVLGNEGQGMNEKQKKMCGNNLVYIPQYSEKTASLNVACAGSIVFNYFAIWAKYSECKFINEKFNVDNKIKLNFEYVKEENNNNNNNVIN